MNCVGRDKGIERDNVQSIAPALEPFLESIRVAVAVIFLSGDISTPDTERRRLSLDSGFWIRFFISIFGCWSIQCSTLIGCASSPFTFNGEL